MREFSAVHAYLNGNADGFWEGVNSVLCALKDAITASGMCDHHWELTAV